MYCKSAIRSMDTKISHGTNKKRHAAGYSYTTNKISHAPFIYINHLIKSTIQLLEKYVLKQVVDFKVPSKIWVSLQFKSNNEQQRTDKKYTGRLTFVHVLQNWELRNDHSHGH